MTAIPLYEAILPLGHFLGHDSAMRPETRVPKGIRRYFALYNTDALAGTHNPERSPTCIPDFSAAQEALIRRTLPMYEALVS